MYKKISFAIDKSLFSKFAKAQVLAIVIDNLAPRTDVDFQTLLDNAKANVVEDLVRVGSYDKHPQVANWLKVFSDLGLNAKEFKPSHIALLTRVLKSKSIPTINPLVDIYNIFSLQQLIPVGGHDLTEITAIKIAQTDGTEQFTPINSDQSVNVDAGEFAYLNQDGKVLTRNLVWRQSNASQTSHSTKAVFIPIDDILGNLSTKALKSKLEMFLELLSTFYQFDYGFAIIDSNLPEVQIEANLQYSPISASSITQTRPQVITDSAQIEQFFDAKIEAVLPSEDEFKKILHSGKRLRFYIGADATAPKLHIGHLLPVLKMAELQKLGHQIIFLIGDFTAQIGDPTDKNATRVKLSKEEVMSNALEFKRQIEQFIDFKSTTNPARLVFNSEWNKELGFADVLELASNFTVQQMLERDMFAKRYKQNKPIHLHEFLYPLMQGYDSVYLEVDGEFGGNDQTFNMLAGRQLLKSYKQMDKFVITTKLLLAADGVNKMSKSIGNCIFIDDSPIDKYGKIMSISDDLIIHYYQLLTNLTADQINQIDQKLKSQDNPMPIKKQLAYTIVDSLHNEAAAQEAQAYFEKTIQKQQMPEDATTIDLKKLSAKINNETVTLKNLLVNAQIIQSGSEAKRLITSGAVDVNDKTITDINHILKLDEIKNIKVGKRNWYKFN